MEPERTVPFPKYMHRKIIFSVDIEKQTLLQIPLKKKLEGFQKLEIKGPKLGP